MMIVAQVYYAGTMHQYCSCYLLIEIIIKVVL